MSTRETVVSVGGKDYRIMVPAGEEGHIQALAQRLDSMMADLRVSDPGMDRDRMLVMACLELADSLSDQQSRTEAQGEAVSRFHRRLADRLEALMD